MMIHFMLRTLTYLLQLSSIQKRKNTPQHILSFQFQRHTHLIFFKQTSPQSMRTNL